MADSAPGYGRRPDEPQCYNCGLSGHWAVGCPEPTRKTPAGLEAWRNTSHSGTRPGDRRSDQKKQKGPIITRYGPPPLATDYSNHRTPSSGWNQYAQPNPTLPQPPPPPPSSRSGYHQPLPPPPPQHLGGYPQYPPQSYQQPPGYYQSSAFPPPGPHDYGSRPPPPPLHDYSAHGRHHQQPPGPGPSYPPSYHAYPSERPPGLPPGLPPPPPLASARPFDSPPRPPPSRGPPGPPPSQHSPPRHRADHRSPQKGHPTPSPSQRRTSSGPPAPGGPIGMAKEDRIAHGLPPKPPPSKVDQGDMRRDLGNRKGQPKQQGNRETNRNRENKGSRRQQKKQNRKNRQRERNQSQTQAPRQESVGTDRQPSLERPEGLVETKEMGAPAIGKENGVEVVRSSSVEKNTNSDRDDGQVVSKDALPKEEGEELLDCWEEEAIFKEAEPTHYPDEVGKPLPTIYTEDILLPRKWDAKCIKSDFFDLDNVEDFVKPIHESKYWEVLQFDPAFSHNGALPSGDLLSTIVESIRRAQRHEKAQIREQADLSPHQQLAEGGSASQGQGLKRKRSADSTPNEKGDHHRKDTETFDLVPEPSPNRNRRTSSSRPGSNAQPDSVMRRASPPVGRGSLRSPEHSWTRGDRVGRESREQRRSRSPDRRWRSPDLRRSRTPNRRRRSPDFQRGRSPGQARRQSDPRRSRSPGRQRQSRSRSRWSSGSTAPSRSSSLDSLERELLGLSSPGKGAMQASEHERPLVETERATKPKRRRAQVDSAYSRRW